MSYTTIFIPYLANAKCIDDPGPTEPRCGYEARMKTAKRHGFSDLSHGEMNARIAADPKLVKENLKEYHLCNKIHNFCD
jgi:hypothetical protein